MTRYVAAFFVLLASLTLGCSSSEDISKAEEQVSHFHRLLDEEKYDSIYTESAEEFRNTGKKEDLVAFLSAVHRKLGSVSSTSRTSWNINYNTGGTFVAMSFDTKFKNGTGQEQFTYHLKNGEAKLVGYHINSNELILK